VPGDPPPDRPPDSAPDSRPGSRPDPVPDLDEAARRKRRRQLILLLTPVSLGIISGYVAAALTPTLLQKDGGHPLALLALDARNRNLILVSQSVDFLPYFLVGFARLLFTDPFTYLLGRRYGDVGLRWVEQRFASLKPTLDMFESIFRRAGWVAVALAPNLILCTLAGASGMSVRVFFAANILGTVARLILLREVGDVLSSPVDAVRRFFDRYIVWTTAASIILTALWFWSERRRGPTTENPAELADELEGAIESAEERPEG